MVMLIYDIEDWARKRTPAGDMYAVIEASKVLGPWYRFYAEVRELQAMHPGEPGPDGGVDESIRQAHILALLSGAGAIKSFAEMLNYSHLAQEPRDDDNEDDSSTPLA